MSVIQNSKTASTSDHYWALPISGHLPNRDSSYTNPKPREDAHVIDRLNGVFIIADGVTRSVIANEYPDPSPATQAAEVFATEAHKAICQVQYSASAREALIYGASQGNLSVRALNKSLFGQDRIDYSTNDFAGACAILALIRDNALHYLYNGDCVGYVEDESGHIQRFTPSQTERFRRWKKDAAIHEQTQEYGRHYVRNKPSHPGRYGVFTGETEALDPALIEVGVIDLRKTERVVLTSDGLDDFLSSHADINLGLPKIALALAEEHELACNSRSDDKTLVFLHVFGPLRD